MLDEIARHERRREPPAIYVGSTTVDTCLPGFRAENDLDLGERDAARQHLDRQSHAHRRASRPAGQHRLRGRRPPPLHAVSARAARRTCTSARSTSRRPARPSAWSISRSRTSSASRRFARGAGARAGRRARPGRRDLHSQHVVAPHRVARRLQRAGELLVAPVAGATWIRRSNALMLAHHDGARSAAASSARPGRSCSATTCSKRTSDTAAHIPPHARRVARRRSTTTARASCARDCCRS